MNYFIILRGPAGVGKTTVAHELAGLLHACHISLDAILTEHNLDYIPGDLCVPEHKMLAANKIIIPMAQEKLTAGKVVIFDGNFYHKTQFDDLIAQLKFSHRVFTLTAGLEECLVRNKTRAKPLDEQEVKNVFALVAKFDYGYVIDTTGQTIDEVVRKIKNILVPI